MVSLDSSRRRHGATVALTLGAIAGMVHGVLAWRFDSLAGAIAIGLAGGLVLLIAGVLSARRCRVTALGLGLALGLVFILARWTGWSLMAGGPVMAAEFLASGPAGRPGWLATPGIDIFWTVEAASMFVPALVGCYVGQERVA